MRIEFDELIERLKVRLSKPLPGAAAHEPLRARPVGSLLPAFDHKIPSRPGSVLMLLYPADGSIKIPLTRRADYIGAHSGQISLPGGKREPGEDYITNALRESEEEIGLDRKEVGVVGRLTDFYVIPSNFIVTPVVGFTPVKPVLLVDQIEVVKILECDVFELIDDNTIREQEILAAKKFRMMAPHFVVEGEIVWGATAMMLNELRLIIREVM